MRGKALQRCAVLGSLRITPAYAGKSAVCIDSKLYVWDHPRLCGEKDENGKPLSGAAGSPPPMRGKVAATAFPVDPVGITPAYAGKSRKTDFRHFCNQDHPRLCGEKSF